MKKKKFISVMVLPLLLTGCADNVKPLVLNPIAELSSVSKAKKLNTNTKVSTLNNPTGGTSFSNHQSTGYPSVYGYETHKCEFYGEILGTVDMPSDYHGYHDCGVRIYAGNTSSGVGSTATIRLNESCPYIDFTDATWLLPSPYLNRFYQGNGTDLRLLLEFKLEITQNGYRCFHAGAKVNLDKDGNITSVTYDKNTSSVNDTNCIKDYNQGQSIDFSKIGKVASSLYAGDYKINVTYRYLWVCKGETASGMTIPNLALVKTTATMTTDLIIDYSKPSLSAAKSSGANVPNGGYSNEAVTVKVTDSHPGTLHYKTPLTSFYSGTGSTSITTGQANGWYYFYATDACGNRSSDFKVYVDTTKPTGQIYANGVAVSSGSYTDKSISYSASDSGSGIKAVYYKTPNSSSFVPYSSGSIIPSTSGDGWYQFYSIDNAGNQSEISKVFLETKSPTVTIKKNGKVVYCGEIKESKTIDTGLYFNPDDTIEFGYSSSSNKCTSGIFQVGSGYRLSETNYPNNVYSETITTALGVKATYQFRIVKSKPTLTLNGKTYTDGASIRLNSDVDALMNIDSAIVSGSNKATITCGDISKTYDLLSQKTIRLEANDNEIKDYKITIVDAANNSSSFTVQIDKKPAEGIFLSNGLIIENGGYTNQPFSFTWEKEGTKCKVSKNGGAQKDYSKDIISEDGQYTFVLTDNVGNTSEFRITLDTIAPTGKIYVDNKEAEDGVVTNKSIYFTWDGDDECLVNGEPYKKNAVIDVEGVYTFVLKDKAGNETAYTAEIDRTAPIGNEEALRNNEDYSVSKWYEVVYEDNLDCFKDYDSALAKAADYEFSSNVKELFLSDVSDFTEYSMVANNGDESNHDDEVREGNYWLYKSIANPDISLYYFDRNLLNEALKHYAESSVSGPHYFDGERRATGKEVTDSIFEMDGAQAPIGNTYVLQNFVASEAYAVKLGTETKIPLIYDVALGEQLKDSGVYEIYETDKAGNTCSYQVIIENEKPKIKARCETYASISEMTIFEENLPTNKTYYLKSFEIEEILDSDPYAVVAVTNSGNTSYYTKGDSFPTLVEGGRYDIRVYDRLHNEIVFTVYISDKEEFIGFENNSDDTEVTIDVSLNDANQTITSLEIYRNGEKLEGVTPDKLHYVFSKDGNYRVVLKDNFGRAIEKEYYFHKSLPVGTLTGVEEGSKTSKDVSFSYDSEKYQLEIYKDGKLVRKDNTGNVLIEVNEANSGTYEFVLINKTDEENKKTYHFAIDVISPNVKLNGVSDNGTTNGSVAVSWDDNDVRTATVSINGQDAVPFENGATFEKEGHYKVEVIDELGNKTIKEFTIDKTVDYKVATSSGKTINGDATTSDDVTISANENVNVTILKDGEKYPYEMGDTLSEEGRYLITLEDDFGNRTSFTIIIDKSVDLTMNVANGGITNDAVTIDSNEKVSIAMTKDGEVYSYELGDEIKEEGTYHATITDAYGNVREVTFQIVDSKARTSIDFDLGEGNTVTKVTKDGEEIGYDSNHIKFEEDGVYEIFYTQDGKEYSFTLTLDTTAPEVSLNGVADGGKVDGKVSISDMSEEGEIHVYKDGEEIPYEIGQELSDYGFYKVVVKDSLGNTRTYTFTLAFQMNGWAIALIAIGVASLIGATAFFVLKRKRLFKK